jgi:hypothetical protein
MRHQDRDEPFMPPGRGRRKTWVEQIDLPMAEKFLLRVIEGHARDGGLCHLKAKTVAREMGCTVRTIFRTISSVSAKGVLRFKGSRYKDDASEYEIIWPGVGRALLGNADTRGVVDAGEAALLGFVTDDTVSGVSTATCDTMSGVDDITETITDDTVSDVGAGSTHDILSATHDILSGTDDILSATDDTMSDVNTIYPHERGRTRSLNHVLNQRIKPCTETGGWGRPLVLADFQSSETIQQLWLSAVKFRYVPNDREMRIGFFATAKCVQRRHKLPETHAHHIRDAGAYFTAAVSEKRWSEDMGDVKVALSAIAMIDGRR